MSASASSSTSQVSIVDAVSSLGAVPHCICNSVPDLLTWFEDGARIPAAFLKGYNRDLLKDNKLARSAELMIDGTAVDDRSRFHVAEQRLDLGDEIVVRPPIDQRCLGARHRHHSR